MNSTMEGISPTYLVLLATSQVHQLTNRYLNKVTSMRILKLPWLGHRGMFTILLCVNFQF